jgi:hypothetical protein
MKSLEELRDAFRWVVVEGYAHSLDDQQVDARIAVINKILREDLLGLQEVADILGTTLSAANMRAHRGKLPLPVTNVGNNRIWTRWDLGDYLAANPDAVGHHEAEEVS